LPALSVRRSHSLAGPSGLRHLHCVRVSHPFLPYVFLSFYLSFLALSVTFLFLPLSANFFVLPLPCLSSPAARLPLLLFSVLPRALRGPALSVPERPAGRVSSLTSVVGISSQPTSLYILFLLSLFPFSFVLIFLPLTSPHMHSA